MLHFTEINESFASYISIYKYGLYVINKTEKKILKHVDGW